MILSFFEHHTAIAVLICIVLYCICAVFAYALMPILGDLVPVNESDQGGLAVIWPFFLLFLVCGTLVGKGATYLRKRVQDGISKRARRALEAAKAAKAAKDAKRAAVEEAANSAALRETGIETQPGYREVARPICPSCGCPGCAGKEEKEKNPCPSP